MGPKLSAWSVIWPKLAASGVIWHTSVMRDLLFSQRVTRDFPLKFPLWLISFETRSRHQLLALFSRSSTSDFLSSNDNRILVNVVNILFYFSMIGVMRDSYPPPPSFATLIPPPPSEQSTEEKFGSFLVSGKLPTYPFPKPTFFPK